MKKNLKSELFRRIRIELAVILVAAIVISMASFANFGVSAETKDLGLTLKNGPDYTFVGNQDGPQFTGETEELQAATDITKVKLDLSMSDYETLRGNMKNGSWGGSATSEKKIYTSSSFAIYFSGTDVTKVGVTQKNFFAALDANKTAFAAGEKVTLTLDISGTFKETGIITGLNIMVSHDVKADVFEGKAFTLENIVFNPSDDSSITPPPGGGSGDGGSGSGDGDGDGDGDGGTVDAAFNELVLKNGPDFKFTGNQWDPQFSTDTLNVCEPKVEFDKIKFDIKMPDVETLRPLMTWGSKGGTASSESMNDSYGASGFALYFKGENVTRIGVTQSDFYKALDDNKEALAAGEVVTLELDLSGNFVEGAKIKGINIMVAHWCTGTPDLSAFNDSPLYLANMHFPLGSGETVAGLKGGPDYKFTGNAWDPQLTIETTKPIPVDVNVDTLEIDIKLADYDNIKGCFSPGSKSVVGGGSFGYGGNDLGIYFEGTNINGVGVTQPNLFAALAENADKLNAGETVTLSLPISGGFAEGAKISTFNIMVAHDSAASTLNNIPISLSNMVLKAPSNDYVPDANELVLKNGPDFKFSASAWDPQLSIATKNFTIPKDTKYMQLQMDIDNIQKLLDNFSPGSRGGGVDFDAFGENNTGYHQGAFGIYFSGNNVSRMGVTQGDLISMLKKRAHMFGKGEMVFIEVPFAVGEAGIPDDAVINQFNWMSSHDAGGVAMGGIGITIKKVTFTAESIAPESEKPVFSETDIKSTNTDKTVVNFEKHKIYVIANSTVGELLDTVWINEDGGFTGYVNYEGNRMANKSKLIADYEFTYAVTHPEGFSVEFEVVPCGKKGGLIDITRPIADPKNDASLGDDGLGDEGVLGEEDLDYEDSEDEYDSDEDYDDEDYDEDEGEQETVIVPSTSGGKNKVVKQTVTENIAMYTIPQLIILIAACVLIGAAIMFIVDLFIIKGKKKN